MDKCSNCQKDLINEPWYSFQTKWGLADMRRSGSDIGVSYCHLCLDKVRNRDNLKRLICVIHEPDWTICPQYFCQHCGVGSEELGTDHDQYYAQYHYDNCEKRKEALGNSPNPQERERERAFWLIFENTISSLSLSEVIN